LYGIDVTHFSRVHYFIFIPEKKAAGKRYNKYSRNLKGWFTNCKNEFMPDCDLLKKLSEPGFTGLKDDRIKKLSEPGFIGLKDHRIKK
jgi:hypothetical protein